MRAKKCPICGIDNSTDALICDNCGTAFTPGSPLKTLEMPVAQVDEMRHAVDHARAAHELTGLTGDSLIFFVHGCDEPLVMTQVHRGLILGRWTPETPQVDMDLTRYGAEALGVSRKHACLYVRDGKLIIEDMNSTNGTRLNGGPLLPSTPYYLQTGDTIRLGHLTLELYFAPATSGFASRIATAPQTRQIS